MIFKICRVQITVHEKKMNRLTEMAYSSDSDDEKVLQFDKSPRSLKPSKKAKVSKSPNEDLDENEEDLDCSAGKRNKKKGKSCATSSNEQEQRMYLD